MFCNKCGREVEDSWEFCNYCGNKFKSENVEESKAKSTKKETSKEKSFIKEFLKGKTKVMIALFSIVSVILLMIYMSEISLGTIPNIYMLTLCVAGIINIAFSFDLLKKTNYTNDLLLLSGAIVFIGSVLRIAQMGINAAWMDLIKYIVIAFIMLLYVYKFLKNKGKEGVISTLLCGIAIYSIYIFITSKLPFVKTFMWKIYNLAEASLFFSYIFVLKSNKDKFTDIPNDLKGYKTQIPTMKIVLGLMCLIILITSGIGFLKNSDNENNYTETTSNPTSTSTATIDSEKEFKGTKDLIVECSTLDSDKRDIITLVRNCSDKTVKEYTLAHIGFDSNGNNVKLGYNEVYDKVSCTSANILPGEVYGIDKYSYVSENIFYVVSTVVEITYMDGTTWKAESIEQWAEKEINKFSVQEYKKKIDNYTTESSNAENNGYLQITNSRKYHSNQFSTKDDLDISIKNVGNKDVRSFTILTAQYDQNGYGVNTSPYDFVLQNMARADADDANLKVSGSDDFSWTLFFSPDCSTFKVIVDEIEFTDGTTWRNPYTLHWILYNQDKR